MKVIERIGDKNQLIAEFMQEYGIEKETDVKLEVVNEGSNGFLGLFGKKPTKVRFFIDEPSDLVESFIEGFFNQLNESYNKLEIKTEENFLNVSIIGCSNPGFFIGKEAKFLNSLQHLLNRALIVKNYSKIKVVVDIDDYRTKRDDYLLEKIKRIADRVLETERSYTLDNMTARDRRIIHKYIETVPELRTLTIGKGEIKRIAVIHSNQNFKPRKKFNASKKPNNNYKKDGYKKTNYRKNYNKNNNE